jgi:hypothetical protein
MLIQQGQVNRAIDVLRSTVALANDPRLPSSLAPNLISAWFTLATWEAETGQRAAAERSFDAFVNSRKELDNLLPEGDSRRAVNRARASLGQARYKQVAGDQTAAYDLGNASIRELEELSFSAGDASSQARDDALQNALGVVSRAALRLGRYAEAEAAARRRMAMPPMSGSSGDDPRKDMFKRRVPLAHAIAKQGRGAEAQTVLAPALAYYDREQKAGAIGTDFRLAYAEALYVNALAQGTDAAGLATRERALARSAELISGASAEVQRLVATRELSGWIASARSSPNS